MVLGDAKTVQEDAEAALKLFSPDAVAATNNMIIRWPGRLDYAVTLHPSKCVDWVGIEEAIRRRLVEGRNRPQTWAHAGSRGRAKGIDRFTEDWAGSTGLLAVKVLLEEGFDRIVLAGVPMSVEGGHFYNAQGWMHATRYHAGWKNHLGRIKAKVRSVSGWTQDLLGAPTPEWLDGLSSPPAAPARHTGEASGS